MIGKKNRETLSLEKPEIKPELKKCLNCFKKALPPPQCKCIPSQCDCPPGPPGPQGIQGPAEDLREPAGPQGAAGGLSDYGYIYNLAAQVVALEADVLFSTNGFLTAGILHAPGTSQIQIINDGIYEVTFSVLGTEPNQFGLFLNGVRGSGNNIWFRCWNTARHGSSNIRYRSR